MNEKANKKTIKSLKCEGSISKVVIYYFSHLYGVDAWDKRLKGFPLSNGTDSYILDLHPYVADSPIYGLSVHGNTAYITSWGACSLLSVDLTSGHVEIVTVGLGQEVLFSLAADMDVDTDNG